MHANIYDDIIANANVVTGFHTYPHVDIRESGVRAADVIVRMLKGEIKPVMRWGNVPMLPHIMCQGTHADPNKSLQARCIELERGEVLAASVFVGFPHADIREAGLSAVVCTDDNARAAEQYRDELLDAAWTRHAQWVFHPEPLEPTIAHAKTLTEGPVILLDHFDNTGSGGTMDTTAVLAEILRQGLENVAFYAICDPQAAEEAAAAGVGKTLTLTLGGKVPMPALKVRSGPLTVTGRVKLVFDGVYLNRGPMYRGVRNDTGLTVVLDTGKVEIVIVSRHQEPFDINCLLSAGIDPLQKRYVALKSRVHWRAGFAEMARAIIECTGVGVTTSDYSQIEFKHVRRPIYPLDMM
jgi:microcystin degradation protein MlrC